MSLVLLTQDCHQARAQVRLPHRYRKTHRVPLRVQQDSKLRHSRSSLGRPRRSSKNQQNTKKDNIQATRSRLWDLQKWFEEFTDDLDDAEVPAHTDTSEDSDSERPTKVAPRKRSIYTHFPKDQNCEIRKRTKITRASWRRRTGEAVPRAENFGDLITADHKVLNMLSWFKIWPVNGFNRTHATEKHFRRRNGVYESFSNRRKSRESFTQTIHWYLANLVETKIMLSSYFNTASIRDEWYCWESGTQNDWRNVCGIVAIRLGWKMVGIFHVMPLLSAKRSRSRTVQDLLANGKNTLRTAIWRTIHMPGHCVWCNGWISSDFCEGPVKAPSSRQESFNWNIHWIRIYRVVNSEKRYFGCRGWGPGKFGRIRNPCSKIQSKGNNNAEKGVTFWYSRSKMEQQNCLEDQGVRESTLTRDQPVGSQDLREELQGNSETSQPLDENKMTLKPKNDFWSIEGDFIHRHHVEPRVQRYVPKQETSQFYWSTLTWPEHLTQIWMCCKRNVLTTIETSTWIEVCQTHGQDSRSVHYSM